MERPWVWEEGQAVQGGKKSKHRITVAFFVSASGIKGEANCYLEIKEPEVFKKSVLPVKYYSENKAWMSGEICILNH